MKRNIFKHAQFAAAITGVENLPKAYKYLASIAFVGRSNVGKSSLINQITEQKNLCRTSKKPGCTQTINLFTILDKYALIDLPGYGYAARSKQIRAIWEQSIVEFLIQHTYLKQIMVLINAMHGLKTHDLHLLNQLDIYTINYQVVLTKVDQIPTNKHSTIIQDITHYTQSHTTRNPEIILTSTKIPLGIWQLKSSIYKILGLK